MVTTTLLWYEGQSKNAFLPLDGEPLLWTPLVAEVIVCSTEDVVTVLWTPVAFDSVLCPVVDSETTLCSLEVTGHWTIEEVSTHSISADMGVTLWSRVISLCDLGDVDVALPMENETRSLLDGAGSIPLSLFLPVDTVFWLLSLPAFKLTV